jgi:hypothetical protein
MFAFQIIDWEKRSFVVLGMEGDQPEEEDLHLPDLVRMLQDNMPSGMQQFAIVVYDDVNQLAFYEDAKTLLEAVESSVSEEEFELAKQELRS